MNWRRTLVVEIIMAGALCRQYGNMTLCGDTRIYQYGNNYQVHQQGKPIQNIYEYSRVRPDGIKGLHGVPSLILKR